MDNNVTKVDSLEKTDPELEKKTSELLALRLAEEKRKADLRQELKIQKARDDVKAKKAAASVAQIPPPNAFPQVQEQIPAIKAPVATPPSVAATPSTPVANGDEYVTQQQLADMKERLNRSFAWIEAFVKEQVEKNNRNEAFITAISNASSAFKK